jgi:hypothetical protein
MRLAVLLAGGTLEEPMPMLQTGSDTGRQAPNGVFRGIRSLKEVEDAAGEYVDGFVRAFPPER